MTEPATALATTEDQPMVELPSLPGPAAKGFDLVPTSFAEAKEFAEFLSTSRIVPKEFHKQPADIFVAVQMGLDLNLRPMQALQNIAVINGKPVMYGDGVLAVVRGSGLLEFINEEQDGDTAICIVKRKGEDPITRAFSIDDAKRAGLLEKPGPWKQYPKRMLQMRARSWALRDGFTDVLKGIAVKEEVEDSGRTINQDAPVAGAAALNEKLRTRPGPAPVEDDEPTQASFAPKPTLDEINEALEAAKTSEDLDAIGKQIATADHLAEDDRAALIFYGKARRKEIEGAKGD